MPGAFAQDAPAYYAAGANVVPIVPGTKRPPAGVTWRPWQTRRQTEADLEELLRAHPAADIAIVTGDPFLDIETDGPDGEQALRDLRLPLPRTAMFESARGLHRLYRSPRPIPSRIGLRPKLDVLTAGRLAVVPSSTGRTWVGGLRLEDAALLPEGWVEFLLGEERRWRTVRTTSPETEAASVGDGVMRPALEEFFRDAEVVQTLAAALGLPRDLRKGFRCILPGHHEQHPSASLVRNASGVIVYHDWHRRSGLEYLTLPEVRAALAYGRVRRLAPPELATWGWRLLVEAGILRSAPVPSIALPPSVRTAVRRVHEGFLLLLGCKWLYAPGEPTAFSWRFAAAWCGLSERHAGEAIRELLHTGALRQVGQHRSAAIFLPGSSPDPLTG